MILRILYFFLQISVHWLILYNTVQHRQKFFFFFLHMNVQLFQYHLLKRLFFLLCQESIGHICMGLLLEFIFYFIDFCVYPFTKLQCLDACLKIVQCNSSNFLLFQNCFCYSFAFPSMCRCLIYLKKSTSEIFNSNYIKAISQFEKN